jgi:hypothetical protein
MPERFAPNSDDLAHVLQRFSVHDPYVLLFGPDNPDVPGLYVLRVMLAVPEDRATEHRWTASTLERARAAIPRTLARWPKVRTTPLPGLLEQWCTVRR